MHWAIREATHKSCNQTALSKKSTVAKPLGFAELKPEGEGGTEAWKGASQPYKHPMHGEEAATTAFKSFAFEWVKW